MIIMPSLYPTLSLPKVAVSRLISKPNSYKSAPMFDFDTGDFVRDAAGRIVMTSGKEAFMEWCLKQCQTERFSRLAYSSKIGVEMRAAMKESEEDPKAVRSAIERTITEALMVHPSTEYVRKFEFALSGSDGLSVTFLVKGRDWDESPLTVVY